jgi:hypothetical protein
MPKAVAVTADDLKPQRASRPTSATRQRGAIASEDLESLGFKLDPQFIHEFKLAALHKGMKLNAFLIYLFREFEKSEKRE